jgi:hypothetical protein
MSRKSLRNINSDFFHGTAEISMEDKQEENKKLHLLIPFLTDSNTATLSSRKSRN